MESNSIDLPGPPNDSPDISLSNRSTSASYATTTHEDRQDYLEDTVIDPNQRSDFFLPPSRRAVETSLGRHKLPSAIYVIPHCSDSRDVPERPVETLGRSIPLHHDGLVPPWPGISNLSYMENVGVIPVTMQTIKRPPSKTEVERWTRTRKLIREKEREHECNVEPTQRVKVRVRLDSGDSMGSEMTCSPVSSPNKCSSNTDSASLPMFSDTPKREATEDKLNITEAIAADPNLRFKYMTPQIKRRRLSQIEGVSPMTPAARLNFGGVSGCHLGPSHLTLLLAELHCSTRHGLRPDPAMDSIEAFFYRIIEEGDELEGMVGCLAVGDNLRVDGVQYVRRTNSEKQLVNTVVRLVRDVDPDILGGWEVQMSSWGYLLERAAHLDINLCPLLSRIPGSVRESKMAGLNGEEEFPGMHFVPNCVARTQASQTSEIKIVGRMVFNLWRLMRTELTLYSYTLENVTKVILGERRPTFSFETLTHWWRSPKTRPRVVEHYIGQLQTTAAILARLDLLARSSELARIFGIQLLEVFSRGSQFRVESSMLRLAKPSNFIPVSPTRHQLALQGAPEYLALILEPESKLYTDPVVVLDFQSLYPSIMIAYNYCYTTCLGRLQKVSGSDSAPYEFGCSQLRISTKRLTALQDHLTISPGGVIFLKPGVRRGILPQMLEDILNTRIMVKQSMKIHKDDPQLQKLLHSRQLGLKLIANVTYGYTAANYSGRMPCIEVGDSVVSKGREALEKAIKTIESNPKWRAKVVYGDTDSVFVLLKGRTKAEAFDIGEEMAKVVSDEHPKPMKLKFEKVYLPCLLQTKKRYVGYMWETRDQLKPVYDAKGIETVRRDGIPATVKILEKTIRLLFETADISVVKSYVQSQFRKIIAGTVHLQDLTFAKEFRGLSGYRPGACVPALELTKQSMKLDRRAVPRSGERVPYVVVYGEPGLNLIQLVRPPTLLLDQPHLRINGMYYITKVIGPPLNRCLLLVGADCLTWLSELPRNAIPSFTSTSANTAGQVISQYFVSKRCLACLAPSVNSLCMWCESDSSRTAILLTTKVADLENAREKSIAACYRCCGPIGRSCISIDCPAMYRRRTQTSKQDHLYTLRTLLRNLQL